MSLKCSYQLARGPCAALRALALAVIALAACATLAAARDPLRMEDPPRPRGDEMAALWQNVQIPGLPTGATLGALWASSPTDVYVWSVEEAAQPSVHSMLLHWNGSTWSVALTLLGEAGVSLHGNCAADVYAATTTAQGLAKMYHFNGVAWTRQSLPMVTTGPAGAITGRSGDVFFRTGGELLRNSGSAWQITHLLEGECVNALAYVGPNEVYANCCTGDHCWNGSAWSEQARGEFARVGASWGIRGEPLYGMLNVAPLSMYAVGRSAVTLNFGVWRYIEDPPGSTLGTWTMVPLWAHSASAQPAEGEPPVIGEPPVEGPGGGVSRPAGDGVAVWGTSPSDVYVAGNQLQTGLLYHFNGTSWHQLTPIQGMPAIADVYGTSPGDFWVSFVNGRLLHYTGGAAFPNPEVVQSSRRAPAEPAAIVPGALAARVLNDRAGGVTLEYALPSPSAVTIAGFDVAGRRVALIERAWRDAGTYQVAWSTSGLARGIYFYRVDAGGAVVSGRVAVVR